MTKQFTSQRLFMLSLMLAIGLSGGAIRTFAQSARPRTDVTSCECGWEIVIRVPASKSDGRPHDGFPDFTPEEIGRARQTDLVAFLQREAPPDVALLLVSLETKDAAFLGCRANQIEAHFNVERLPKLFALLAVDLDGDSLTLGKKQYHDYLAGAIFTAEPWNVAAREYRRLNRRIHKALRRAGVRSLEYPSQIFRANPQVPHDFRVVGWTKDEVIGWSAGEEHRGTVSFKPPPKKTVAQH